MTFIRYFWPALIAAAVVGAAAPAIGTFLVQRRLSLIGDGVGHIALAGVAPIPWLLDSVDALDAATPLPRTEWKVPVARALVERALAAIRA